MSAAKTLKANDVMVHMLVDGSQATEPTCLQRAKKDAFTVKTTLSENSIEYLSIGVYLGASTTRIASRAKR